jgi:protocatechuate 3,4-dioxygenase beta subunit
MRCFCAALLVVLIASAASAAPQTLAGRVLDAQGAPVAGAEVTAYFKFNVPEPHQMRLQRVDGAVVGADGRFTIKLTLPQGCAEVVVIARKGDMAPSWATFDFNPWRVDESQVITLEPSASIAGTVSDEAGKPIAGAEVTADVYLPPHAGRERRVAGGPPLDWLRTKTDAQGAFTIKDLPKSSSADLHVTAPRKGGLFLEKRGEMAGAFDAGAANIRVTLHPEARIQGIVVDEDTKKPVSGISVLIVASTETVETDAQVISTGQDGTFEASGLPAADYTISLAKFPDQLPTALTEPLPVKDVRTGEVRKAVVLTTTPGGMLEVVVVNEKKEPISGAHVSVLAIPDGDLPQSRPVDTAFSGKDGVAAFRILPGDYRVIQIDHELCFQQSYDPQDTVDVEKGKTLRMDVAVSDKPHASGVVLDPQGKPVAGATVKVMPFPSDAGATTDKDGKFEVRWRTWNRINDTSASLLVRKPEAGLVCLLSLEDQEQTDNLKITLAPGITITGAVVDPDNRPIPRAQVSVNLQRERYSSNIQDDAATTGQDGKYAVRALPDGENYFVRATADDFGRIQSPVDVSTAQDRTVTVPALTLKPANLTVTGVVVDADDKPVSGAQVNVSGNEQNTRPVQSDTNGKFTLKNLCDAEAMIHAWRQLDGEQLQGSVNYSADMKEVKIVLGENAGGRGQRAEIVRASGVVLDAQGQPVPGATVQMMPNGRQARKTDKEGKFKLSWQHWPGQNMQAVLLVRAPKADLAAVFSPEGTEKLDDLKITLAPGITITGTVADPDNKPIPKASLQLSLQQNSYNSSLQERISTDKDGKYIIRALPADLNYQLTTQANGFGRMQSPVDLTAAKNRTVEMETVVLKRANLTITGTVVDEDDKPVSGANINASGDEQNIPGVMSGKGGKFILKNVCDGDVIVRAWKQGGGMQLQGSVNYSADMKEVRIVLGQNADGFRRAMPKPKVPAEQLFAEGQKAMDDQNWTEAVAKFKQLAEKYPTHALTADALSAAIGICENRLNDQKTADELRKKEAALKEKR